MERNLVHLEEQSGKRSPITRTPKCPLGERNVTEQVSQHQSLQQTCIYLWNAVKARGCQFLGPAVQEKVLRLILLALEDGSALSRKALVMFTLKKIEPDFPLASKTNINHVVHILYRASCFEVSKRENESSLMVLKEEFRTYDSLRREHDAQIVEFATDAGVRFSRHEWSLLLYGDTAHKSHMQSIVDSLKYKLKKIPKSSQPSQSFVQSVKELVNALERTNDTAESSVLSPRLEQLPATDPNPDLVSPSFPSIDAMKNVMIGLANYVSKLEIGNTPRSNINKCQNPSNSDCTSSSQFVTINYNDPSSPNHSSSTQSSTLNHPYMRKYKVSICHDAMLKTCSRGDSCTFAHSINELKKFRTVDRIINSHLPDYAADHVLGNESESYHNMTPYKGSNMSHTPLTSYNSKPVPLGKIHRPNEYDQKSSTSSLYPMQLKQNSIPVDIPSVNHNYKSSNNQVCSFPTLGTRQQRHSSMLNDQNFDSDYSSLSLDGDVNGYLDRNFDTCNEPMLDQGELKRWLSVEQITFNSLYENNIGALLKKRLFESDSVINHSSDQIIAPMNHFRFVRSNSILADEECVPFEIQSPSKFGPITRFNASTSTIKKTSATVECNYNHRSS